MGLSGKNPYNGLMQKLERLNYFKKIKHWAIWKKSNNSANQKMASTDYLKIIQTFGYSGKNPNNGVMKKNGKI